MNAHIARDNSNGTITRIGRAYPSPKGFVSPMIGIRAQERLADSRLGTAPGPGIQL